MKVAFSILVLGLAMSAFGQSNDMNRDWADINKVFSEIKTVAAIDISCFQDSDCTTLAYGSRACGGPQGNVITSKFNPKLTALEALVETSIQKQRDFNQRYQIGSSCDFEMPPVIACVKNTCQQVPR